MNVKKRREIDLAHLRFLRWLAERGGLEHETAGRSYGLYALADLVLAKADAAQGGALAARYEASE